jgi:16S rRNA G966 N2-methylase RsmD
MGDRGAARGDPVGAGARDLDGKTLVIIQGDALDLILAEQGEFDLIATDPPYAFGGSGAEHAISATVAVVLREAAQRLKRGRWMLVMCASSWRSQSYMVEAVRGVVEPVRVGTWCKPKARTKVATGGWAWASVKVIAFRKGKAENCGESQGLDHITAAPVMNGRRAQLPLEVAQWMVAPFAVAGGRFLDPFAGSGMLVQAAGERNMEAIGFEKGAASLHAGEDAAAQIAPPGEPALPPSATAGENPARPVSVGPVVELADTPPRGGGAATAVQVRILPGPPSSSRKAKPGTPCGGPSCRETQQWWIHDPRTCPLYAGKAAG